MSQCSCHSSLDNIAFVDALYAAHQASIGNNQPGLRRSILWVIIYLTSDMTETSGSFCDNGLIKIKVAVRVYWGTIYIFSW
jgi:hypothetical protein